MTRDAAANGSRPEQRVTIPGAAGRKKQNRINLSNT